MGDALLLIFTIDLNKRESMYGQECPIIVDGPLPDMSLLWSRAHGSAHEGLFTLTHRSHSFILLDSNPKGASQERRFHPI